MATSVLTPGKHFLCNELGSEPSKAISLARAILTWRDAQPFNSTRVAVSRLQERAKRKWTFQFGVVRVTHLAW